MQAAPLLAKLCCSLETINSDYLVSCYLACAHHILYEVNFSRLELDPFAKSEKLGSCTGQCNRETEASGLELLVSTQQTRSETPLPCVQQQINSFSSLKQFCTCSCPLPWPNPVVQDVFGKGWCWLGPPRAWAKGRPAPPLHSKGILLLWHLGHCSCYKEGFALFRNY